MTIGGYKILTAYGNSKGKKTMFIELQKLTTVVFGLVMHTPPTGVYKSYYDTLILCVY